MRTTTQLLTKSSALVARRCFCNQTLSGLASSWAEPLPRGVKPSHRYDEYALKDSWDVGRNSKILRFSGALPVTPPPTGLKVLGYEGDERVSKSYSPVSMPDEQGHFDLLVKWYEAPEGSTSRYLCGLEVGETATMWIKPAKDIYEAGKYEHVGLIAGGTGLAPLYQLALSILTSPTDSRTQVSLIFSNRAEADILMREDLERLAAEHPDRFSVHHTLSQPPENGWSGSRGRISLDTITAHAPAPSPTTKVYVCGTDGFLETVCGPKVRLEGQHAKVQGPTLGLLLEAGFDESMVHKL